MPLLDLPLDKLYDYQGRNPKPDDHAAYWDRALAEQKATDPAPRLTRVDFPSSHAELFDLRFTGVGGADVYAKYLRPKGKKNCPVILQFHGYTWFSGDWSEKLGYVAEGIAVVALDCRGQGGRSNDPGGATGNTHHGHIIRGLAEHEDKLYYRNMYLDIPQLVRVLSDFDEIDATRMGSMGGSQGGALALVCAALAPVKKCFPWHPFLCDFKRVYEMDLAKGAYAEIRNYIRMFDPRHERIEEMWTRLGYIDVQHLADRITGEVKMVTGLSDDICPPSTQFAAFNKIRSEKSVVIYPDFAHEGMRDVPDLAFRFFSSL